MMKLLLALALLQVAAAKPGHEGMPSVLNPAIDARGAPRQFVLKEHSVHQRRFDIKKGPRADGNTKHQVIFAVKQNIDELKALVDDISNPFSSNYGKHLKRSEVTSMTAIPDSYQHVVAFLKFHGIEIVKTSKNSDYITASAEVSKWEELFATEFYSFEMESHNGPLIRAEQYSLPDTLHDHVEAVLKTVQFPFPIVNKMPIKTRGQFPGVPGALEEGYMSPALLYSTYDIRSTAGSSLASQGVYETQAQSASPSDLAQFQTNFGLPADTYEAPYGFSDDDACGDNIDNCAEGNLDIQYITAVASGVPTYYMYDSSGEGNGDFVSWATTVAEWEEPPLVLSISWGIPELFLGSSVIDMFNVEALKLSSMGVTLITASGDDGAAGFLTRFGAKYCGYTGDFPSASIYVTSVGATMGPETGDAEVACQVDKGGRITTGGGFSALYGTPSWQTASVSSYMTQSVAEGTTPISGFNSAGRGFPDVSLAGVRYLTVLGGEYWGVSGTSASAPTFGGMVSLVNSKRLEAGKSALGWINPALYALSEAFVNDITAGSNFCGVGEICCGQGFTATKGWDPVTGLGSVNYTAFETAFFALGDNPNIPTAKPTRPPSSTVASSRNPTTRPTREPTAAPTSSAGWLYANYYSEDGCTGDINRVEAFRSGVCIAGETSDGEPMYFMYVCDENNAHAHAFSDSACQNRIDSGALRMSLGSCSSTDHYYYYSDVTYSYKLQCSTGITKPLDSSLSYTLERYFDTVDGCNAADEFRFDAYHNKNCFSQPAYDYSFKFRWPSVISYTNSSTCEGESETVTLPSDCINEVGSSYYYYGHVEGSIKYQYVGASTTRQPSRKPTAAPSHKAEHYKMNVEQTISGISSAEFYAVWDVASAVLAATYANCMEGIEADDITINSVTDVTSARLRRLTASQVSVDFTVSYDAAALGFSGDAEGAYNSLINQLVDATGVSYAIGGTHFNRFLADNIAAFDASVALDDVSGGTATSAGYAADVDDDPSVIVNHKKRETRYFIIGVIAGGGGFLLLSWIVIYGIYYIRNPAGEIEGDPVSPSQAPRTNAEDFEAVNVKEPETKETEMTPAADHK